MRRVLISTLGESPGVVTEAIDLLKSNGINLDKVLIISTVDMDAQGSMDLLLEHIPEYYGIEPENVLPIYINGIYNDIDSTEAVVNFLQRACSLLKDYIKDEVYVSIAGGRKTMAATMTLAVQLYGAKSIFHIILDNRETELKSHIRKLKQLEQAEQIKVLHPEVSKVRIVTIPFIGLFPFIGEIVKGLQTGEASEQISSLLIENGLLRDRTPTEAGRILLQVLEGVESMPGPCPGEPKIHLTDHSFRKEREYMANQLKSRFNFICEIRDSPWKEGQPKVRQTPPNKLEVYFKSQKGFLLALTLLTSAKTEGQLTKAANLIKEFLDMNG
jgi:CRISPR-associated protein Csx14